ncbi:MAG: ABC transporter substrate-binding protein [Propionibacteriaceae bacterium]|nr:ABC transporter substrate-binding protein [Propionibacteriaceae bacterium]
MKLRTLLAGAVASAMLLSGCGGSADAPKETTTTLTYGSIDRGESLDAASAYIGWYNSRDGITETLVDVDDQLNLVPKLATAWENTDDMTWKITLRDAVTFHNGNPMDAAAVKASLEYAIATNVRAQAQLPIESMTADGQTLTITTKTPVAALPSILSDPMTGIQAIGEGIDPVTAPQGTGPFKVTEFTPTQKLELDAYEGYWGGKPQLTHVTWRAYSDLQAMGLALQSGEIQVAVQPEASGLAVFSDPSRYTTWQVTSTRADTAILNTTSPITSDPRAREAIDYAFDRDGYVSVMNAMGKDTYALFPESVVFGGTEGLNLKVNAKDLDKAKALFLEMGYTETDGKLVKDDQPLTLRLLTYPKRPQLGQMAQLFQADMATIGVDVKISELPSTSDQMKSGEYEIGMYSFAMAPTGDPQYFFETMLRTGGESNFAHYSSAELDAALDDLAATFDPEQRLEKTRMLKQIALSDLPVVPYGHAQWWVVSDASVKGLNILPTEYHLLTHETHVE